MEPPPDLAPAPPLPLPLPPPSQDGPNWPPKVIAAAVVAVLALVVGWLCTTGSADEDEPPAAVEEPKSAQGATAAAPRTSIEPRPAVTQRRNDEPPDAPKDNDVVALVLPDGSGRFISGGTTICRLAQRCEIPIDADARVERGGFEPVVLVAKELRARAGQEWVLDPAPPR